MNKQIVYIRYTSDNDSSAQQEVMLMSEGIKGCDTYDFVHKVKVNILEALTEEEIHKPFEQSGLDIQSGFEELINYRIHITLSKAIVLISSVTEVLLEKITRTYISIYLDIPYLIGYNLI